MAKAPWIFLPAGPLGWRSHEQILPVLCETWKATGARLERLWFPRPKITDKWVDEVRKSASVLVFPLGIGHYDSLWFLSVLRSRYNLKIPAVIMVASDLTKGFRALFDYKEYLTSNDLFVTNCEAEKRLVETAFKKTVKVEVMPLPVSESFFSRSSKAERAKFKKGLGINKNEPLFLYAGRISVQKNVHGLIRLFSEFRKVTGLGKLFILGSADDIGTPHFKTEKGFRYIHELAGLISSLNLEDDVIFPGNLSQEDLGWYLRSCDIHLSTTLHSGEDFGYSIAQGLACGAPTLVSEWGGGKDFVKGGGAVGIPTLITLNGPRINFMGALNQMIILSNEIENERWRGRGFSFAKENLSQNSIAQSWSRLFKNCKATIGGKPVTVLPLFDREFPVPFHFRSPKDKLYLLIGEIYSSGTKRRGRKAYFHPLYHPKEGYLADPIAPIKIVPAKASRKKLVELGILL